MPEVEAAGEAAGEAVEDDRAQALEVDRHQVVQVPNLKSQSTHR